MVNRRWASLCQTPIPVAEYRTRQTRLSARSGWWCLEGGRGDERVGKSVGKIFRVWDRVGGVIWACHVC
jgi:hypothetical protein